MAAWTSSGVWPKDGPTKPAKAKTAPNRRRPRMLDDLYIASFLPRLVRRSPQSLSRLERSQSPHDFVLSHSNCSILRNGRLDADIPAEVALRLLSFCECFEN